MTNDWASNLKKITLTAVIEKQLAKYYQLIIEYNNKQNLTTITSETDVYYKHFYDALLISNDYQFTNQKICDVGSGVGVPGLVLKICFPEIKLTIIEANQKKCQFLTAVVERLNLTKVLIINERAEIYARGNREIYDLVVARALAPLTICNELCLPLIKPKGQFIAYKGLNAEREIAAAEHGLVLLSATISRVSWYQLPFNLGTRKLVIITKNDKTPSSYPRNYQQIKNKPL